jgi:hypothetical protein
LSYCLDSATTISLVTSIVYLVLALRAMIDKPEVELPKS